MTTSKDLLFKFTHLCVCGNNVTDLICALYTLIRTRSTKNVSGSDQSDEKFRPSGHRRNEKKKKFWDRNLKQTFLCKTLQVIETTKNLHATYNSHLLELRAIAPNIVEVFLF